MRYCHYADYCCRSELKVENPYIHVFWITNPKELGNPKELTTNLTKNLDKAFERRFIYKIEFAKPDIKTSKKIWHSMLPELKPEELDIIAKKYLFSGGQIENVTRKKTINYILNGDDFTFEKLCAFCDDEQIVNSQIKVGY